MMGGSNLGSRGSSNCGSHMTDSLNENILCGNQFKSCKSTRDLKKKNEFLNSHKKKQKFPIPEQKFGSDDIAG